MAEGDNDFRYHCNSEEVKELLRSLFPGLVLWIFVGLCLKPFAIEVAHTVKPDLLKPEFNLTNKAL